MEKQSISDWVAITKTRKSGWAEFYRSFLSTPLSDIPRFLKAVDTLGHGIMFEAILAASTRKLTGDPLNYVIAIGVAKVNDEIKQITEDDKYKMRLEKGKERTISQNEELESKIRKAKGIAHGQEV